jgi:hypothetical protein
MIQEHVRRSASLLLASALIVPVPGWAGGNEVFSPNNLVLSRSVYQGISTTVNVGDTLPPGCVKETVMLTFVTTPPPATPSTVNVTCSKATANGVYPTVFNNNVADGSFGVTSPIFLDQLTTGGLFINSLPIDSSQIVTSYSSKSELAVNKSLDGKSITFVGYVGGSGFPTGPNHLDVSNSNTPGVVDPTNPVVSQYYRSVAELDAWGNLAITRGNAYSGNNGRAAIKADTSSYYMTGNDNNGGLAQKLTGKNPTDQITTTQDGINLITSTGVEFLVPGAAPPSPPNIAKIGDFEITQAGFASPDKAGKDNNFRGLTIFDNTLYVTKGSGSNGINTVYKVGTTGTLPTPANAPGGNLLNVPITILPGLWNTLAANTIAPLPRFPFGIWFADANTLYVGDEGDGTMANSGTDTMSGLEKWVFDGTNWNLKYTLQKGLNLGVQYTVATPPGQTAYPAAAADGLRNITGRLNTDGTVNIWAVTSTVSTSGDQGADPNQLVFITDNLASTTAPAKAQFQVLRTAEYGEVLRGVSFAPGMIEPAPISDTACNGVYNGTFRGNLKISAGQNCVFVGGSIDGNVQLDGGSLSLTNVAVGGNVQINGGGTFSIGPSASINGNLQIQNIPGGEAQNQVCDTRIDGNVQFQNNGTAVQIGSAFPACTGNTIGGNLQVQNNTGKTWITDNTVNGNLQDQSNTGSTQVFDNTVTHNLQCSGNSAITGGGNTAKQKQGQCSSF